MRIKKNWINFLRLHKGSSNLDGIIDGVIFGWIISSKGFPSVEVWLNDKKVYIIDDGIPAPNIHPEAYRFFYDLKRDFAKEKDKVLLICKGKEIKKTPIQLSKELIFGMIDGFSGIECTGWAGSALGEIPKLLIEIDNEKFEPELEWFFRDDFKRYGIKIPTGFKFKIPEKYLDGRTYKISLLNPYTYQKLCKDKEYRFQIKNTFVDKADFEGIAGWLQVGDYPGPVELDVYIEDKKIGSTKANYIREDAVKEYGEGCYGFYYSFSEKDRVNLKNKENYTFSLYLSDTNIKISDQYKTASIIDILEGLEKTAQSLREQDNKLLSYYLKITIDSIRMNFSQVFHKKVVFKDVVKLINTSDIADVVDVIIPIYKGREETLECIKSVLEAKTNVKFELILIDDCSPDLELKKDLQKLAKEGKCRLIENNENLGFVKSVNLGMKFHPNRDVVLLNSDTLVPDYWLDRLREAAYSAKNIATVTPLSNRATILSIPNPNVDNEIPDGLDYQVIDNLCEKVNRGVYIDIPTAVGFCMYIKRECLNEIGYFDEVKFDKGYGEENDFCLRASALGWRHIACLDLFVQHHGSLSFGEEKPERVKKALKVIEQLYPDYNQRIQRFIKKDPIAPYRNKIIKEIIKEKYSKFFLFIIHSWGGGSFKYCKDLAKILNKEEVGSILMYLKNEKVYFSLLDSDKKLDETLTLQVPAYLPPDKLIEELKDLPFIAVHFNQTMNFKNLDIWQIPEWLKIPYYVTIHDYFYFCPRITLINSGGIFCDIPEPEICEGCLSNSKLEYDIEFLYNEIFESSIIKWRKFYEECLKKAKKVIFPSESTIKYYQKIFNLQNILYRPHPEYFEARIKPFQREDKLRIAIIGAIGEHKGYSQIQRLIDFSDKQNLPFEFIFIGYTKDDKILKKYKNVSITGPYEESELLGLINVYKPHIALFLHIWPETYNYTLSESLQAGLYPVAYNLGALAERMKKLQVGTLILYPSSTEKIAEILMELYTKGWESKKISINNQYNLRGGYYEIF